MKQTPAYDVANADMLSLVPDAALRVADVGCMLGTLACAIRQRSPQTKVTGIDIDPHNAERAAEHCDATFSRDIETGRWDGLCPSHRWAFGNCLEHLRDPWTLLQMRTAIDDDGCLLVCLPNARHWSVQWRLASGQFRYEISGLRARTHGGHQRHLWAGAPTRRPNRRSGSRARET